MYAWEKIVSVSEGKGWPETHPDKRGYSQCLAWHLITDWLILVSFSNCPRRCCFSLAHAAQASMARFLFSWHLISLQENTNYQPFAKRNAQASIAAPARTQACMQWENSKIKHICKRLKQCFQSTVTMTADTLLNNSVSPHFICLFGFFSWSSLCLSAPASLFFSTGGSCAAKYCDALQKGKEHLLQPVKPLSDQNTTLILIVLAEQICMCCFKKMWCLSLLSTVKSKRTHL